MEKVLALIQAKNEDLEARSRRNNLRITGLPESTNMGKCKTYIENLIKEIIGHENLSSLFIIEWAHRSLAAKPIPGATPRPIIARVLNYRDRDNILRMAREKGTINFQGNSISFFPRLYGSGTSSSEGVWSGKEIPAIRRHSLCHAIPCSTPNRTRE